MSKIQEIGAAIESGKGKNVQDLIGAAIGGGLKPMEVLQGMIDTMGAVGEKFKDGQIYVPEMLIAARAMKKGLETLKPHLVGETGATIGKFIIGTVAGDLHDIGKNLVAMMVESQGFEVIDLGVDVKAEKFIEAIKANPDCKVLGISALLTTTMPAVKETLNAFVAAGVRNQVKVMVGGAPVTQGFVDSIGADGFAADAATAASKAKELNKRLN
ncbi:MAG: cobalamin-dependent protein [Deltaproteobacteria bacterium]|nr:cobalamin-dependent protein [Deltaproteobacteria bacterium]